MKKYKEENEKVSYKKQKKANDKVNNST